MSNSIKAACLEIFRESFEGVAPGSNGTWYVEGREAIFNSLSSISAEEASRILPGQRSTIGAHANHLCYYLSLFNANLRGEKPDADWSGSWAQQEFDEDGWRDVEIRTKSEFAEAIEWYRSDTDFRNDDHAVYAVANVAHAAFHLGAIRALIPQVQ